MKKFNKNKYLLLLVISWLITRLKVTLEYSRLALLRIQQIPEVRIKIKQPRILQKSEWCWERDKLFVLKFDKGERKIIVKKFPLISKN